MLANLTAFSGTGIKIITRDSIIPLPKAVARENVKELIRKDSLETEISVLKTNYSLLEQTSSYKDTIIESKSRQIDLYKEKEKTI